MPSRVRHPFERLVRCTPAAGWEKGQVENQVGTARRRLFVPRRHANDLAGLNEALAGECVSYAKRHPHPEQKSRTVWEVFEEERPSLQALSEERRREFMAPR